MGMTFEIDTNKLADELKKRGLGKSEISVALGHGRSFMSDSLRRGRLNNGAGKMLEVLYDIKKDSYEKKPQIQKDTTKETPANEAIDIKDLYTLIYEAVKQAGIDARREWEKERRSKQIRRMNNESVRII